MTTKAKKAAKKAQRDAEAQRMVSNPAEAILGKGTGEAEDSAPTKDIDAGEFADTPAEAPAEETAPETPEPEATTEEKTPAEETAPETPEAAKPATSLEEMVAGLSPELRESALEQIGKLRVQAEKNEANKRYAQFDTRMKDAEKGIVSWITGIAKECGVDLAERAIKVSFPKGEGGYAHSAIGKKGEATGRNGFPSSWGEATEVGKKGKVIQTQSSPSKLAEKMGLQVEGMRDMMDVFQNPRERGTKRELPKTFQVEAVRGEYFRVKHLK